MGGEWAGDLHHTQYFVARSHKWKSKKWPSKNTLCAHLSVAWRVSSLRPLGVSAGGTWLLESMIWISGSASWAAPWQKICGRVHWKPNTQSLESDWKKNEQVIQIFINLVSRLDFIIFNQLSSQEFQQHYFLSKEIMKNWKKTTVWDVALVELFSTYASQIKMK